MKNLLASMEAELNKVHNEHRQAPDDETIASKKEILKNLMLDYVALENRFKTLIGVS